MKEINIAKTLANKRRAKGITQDELAEFIGVSKASVSKWETGQSYPDITFLPRLAAYFNISIDELMDYSPKLTKDAIRKLYHRLAADFAAKPFDEVMSECREIIKKYFACFPLLLQMATLFLNHHMLAGEQGRREEILRETVRLCERIQSDSGDVWVAKDAAQLKAICLLTLGEAQTVLELLGETIRADMPERSFISQAYKMLGNVDKAKEVSQIDMCLNLMSFFSAGMGYVALCTDDFGRAEEALKRLMGVAEIYRMESLNPNVMALLYALGAQVFLAGGSKEKSIEFLNRYVDVCVNGFFPFTLHGDSHFDKIDDFFSELNLGSASPRSESVIKQSMMRDILLNPSFSALAEEPGYNLAVEKLRNFIGGS
ncbi:MAG: helix-turn-helix domain-containing protein [Clostridiales bacterium]|jgi:transcriptional regulator with XRE-family HTH domain|nr:helix-turn-helix domain-containing protein [Clostridiales bacterium]